MQKNPAITDEISLRAAKMDWLLKIAQVNDLLKSVKCAEWSSCAKYYAR